LKDKNVFFGYYDKTPFSHDDSKVLAVTTKEHVKPLIQPIKGSVGYFDLEDNNKFIEIGKTNTINWQQGCRLMWHPKYNSQMLYNTAENGKYFTKVFDTLTNKHMADIPVPIYDIDSQGENIATLNFSRLHNHRSGYGYVNYPDENEKEYSPENDGVWLFNIASGGKELLCRLNDLKLLNYSNNMDNSFHYINHLSFNPSGSKLLFYHLWYSPKGRWCIPYVYDMDKGSVKEISLMHKASHYTWLDNDQILIYSKENNVFNYHLYNLVNNEFRTIGSDLLIEDGHPTFLKNGNLLTDSYPDKYGYLKLIKFKNDKIDILGKFHLANKYQGEVRCDLHPSVSFSGEYCAVDFMYKGNRAISIINLYD
jgi:hypothetical protein